jgi:hypothetical protein
MLIPMYWAGWHTKLLCGNNLQKAGQIKISSFLETVTYHGSFLCYACIGGYFVFNRSYFRHGNIIYLKPFQVRKFISQMKMQKLQQC